jgi:hypothetical protein
LFEYSANFRGTARFPFLVEGELVLSALGHPFGKSFGRMTPFDHVFRLID